MPLTDVSGLPIFIQLHWCLLHSLFKNRFKLAIILQWAKCILQHITSNYTQVHYGTTTWFTYCGENYRCALLIHRN